MNAVAPNDPPQKSDIPDFNSRVLGNGAGLRVLMPARGSRSFT
jgi:hypothetical protein